MKSLKEKYEDCIYKFAEANHKILIEKVPYGPEYKYWNKIEKTNLKKAFELYLKMKELNQLEELTEYLYSTDEFIAVTTAGMMVIRFPEITKPVLLKLKESNTPTISMTARANLKEAFGIPLFDNDES